MCWIINYLQSLQNFQNAQFFKGNTVSGHFAANLPRGLKTTVTTGCFFG